MECRLLTFLESLKEIKVGMVKSPMSSTEIRGKIIVITKNPLFEFNRKTIAKKSDTFRSPELFEGSRIRGLEESVYDHCQSVLLILV